MSVDRITSPVRLRARTRAALGQLVGGVLSAPLGALESRLARANWVSARPGLASAPGGRLREVLDRDRALAAAEPSASPTAQPESATTVLAEPAAAAEALAPTLTPAAATEASGPALEPATVVVVAAPVPDEGAQTLEFEPIRTRTMARLLAAQGYRARALAIYQALLAECPSDLELQGELERLRASPG